MQLNELRPVHRSVKSKRIGRGGKRGTYSGKGIKGQLARSGRKLRPELRDIIKKIPKKRGYSFASIQTKPQVVSLRDIERLYESGSIVSPETLVEKKIIGRKDIKTVKILGKGPVQKKLTLQKVAVSKGAKEAIEKAGGTVS